MGKDEDGTLEDTNDKLSMEKKHAVYPEFKADTSTPENKLQPNHIARKRCCKAWGDKTLLPQMNFLNKNERFERDKVILYYITQTMMVPLLKKSASMKVSIVDCVWFVDTGGCEHIDRLLKLKKGT